jgi:Uma2 family endonuclease
MAPAWYNSRLVAKDSALPARSPRRYLRPPEPLHFPSSEEMPETALHLRLRTALFLVLDHRLSGQAFIGSDQFVYWDPTDPSACLAPDAFVRLGCPFALLPSFKVWEHGAPNLAVEIISATDARDRNWQQKLVRYARCGVAELVRYDPEEPTRALRIWDLLEGDLVERELSEPGARFSEALGAYWVIASDPVLGKALRIAADAEGRDLWPTRAEAKQLESEAERAEKERERAEKEAERAATERERAEKEAERAQKEAALARVAELERELERRRGGAT